MQRGYNRFGYRNDDTPEVGDLCLCLAEAGDSLFIYTVLKKIAGGYRKTFNFEGYDIGGDPVGGVTPQQMRNLDLGKTIKILIDKTA